MAYLTVNSGSQTGHRHLLNRPRVVLGRHPDCDIVVDAGAVSRHHAQVLQIGDECFIEDLNSRNGTFVNDRMIFGRQRLEEGDRIRVCDIQFAYHGQTTPPEGDESGHAILVDDTQETTVSTIMSKLEVSASDEGSVHFTATSDAKLQALLEITRSLGRSLSLDQVLPQVLNSLFKVFLQADRGFIVLRNEMGELVPRWTKLRHNSENETIRISRTIMHEVMQSKQAILSADAPNDPRFEMSQSIADFRIRSMICAPLINSDEQVIGVLQVDTIDQRHRFRKEDLEVLVSVAIQAAIAIENAQLYEFRLRQRELERDLEVARQVQLGFLPDNRPTLPGYEFFEYYQPANQIGGDYYDYIMLPNNRLAILVADVVGHGIAAALLMSKLAGIMRTCIAREERADKALTELNRTLTPETFDGRFITLVMVILDPGQHSLTVVNAGHMPPLFRRCNGRLEQIGDEASGLPLLVDAEIQYQQYQDAIQPGDSFLLFTDGVTEMMNPGGEQFGMTRIESCVDTASPTQWGEKLITELQDFGGGRPAQDDICLVCCGRAGP